MNSIGLRPFLEKPILVAVVLLGAACGQPQAETDAAQANSNEVAISRVATFANRAAGAAGLTDPTGRFADYLSSERTGDTWSVRFALSTCQVSSDIQECPDDEGELVFEIALRGDKLAVTEVRGPSRPDERNKLAAYREPATPERPLFVFPDPQLAQGVDEGLAVMSTAIWTGPIPPPRISFECRVELDDPSGRQIYEGRPVPMDPPQQEGGRSGAIYSFGTPGLNEDVAESASKATVVCVDVPK